VEFIVRVSAFDERDEVRRSRRQIRFLAASQPGAQPTPLLAFQTIPHGTSAYLSIMREKKKKSLLSLSPFIQSSKLHSDVISKLVIQSLINSNYSCKSSIRFFYRFDFGNSTGYIQITKSTRIAIVFL